jgi:hypothetical protein
MININIKNTQLNYFLIILLILLFSFFISNILVRNFFLNSEQFFFYFDGLISQVDNYKQIYNCEVDHSLHERHRLRWVFLSFWIFLFEYSYGIFENKNLIFNFYKFLISFIIFISFIFLIRAFDFKKNLNQLLLSATIYIIFFLLISSSNISEINYSILEFFFLSGALYFSIKKNFLFFLIFCCASILNRETGFILLFIYFLFNANEINKFFIILIVSSLLYAAVNFSLLKCIFVPGFLITINPTHETTFDFNTISLIKIIIQDYLLTLIIFFLYWNKSVIQKKILIIFFIYTFAFLIGTPFQHSIIKILFIPLLLFYINSESTSLKK